MSVEVPGWMRRIEPGQVNEHVQSIGRAVDLLDSAGREFSAVLAEAAGVLGWRSDGALEARTRLTRADGQVGIFRDLLEHAKAALASLEAAIAEHQPPLKRLLSSIPMVTSGRGPALPVPDAETVRRIREHAEALALADRTARDTLLQVSSELGALAATGREDEWVGSTIPDDVGQLLSRYGVTESQAERALLDEIALHGGAELRGKLSRLPPAELADFLLRHPDIARRLGGGLMPESAYPPGSPESRLSEALEVAPSLPSGEAVSVVHAAFGYMSPRDQQMMALLYPDVVGNLDGAPLDARVAANRVNIGIALDDDRARWTDIGPPTEGGFDTKEKVGHLIRTANYKELLYGQVPNPRHTPDNGQPESVPHQILFFDATGDGRLAEMWGTPTEGTGSARVLAPAEADVPHSVDQQARWRRLQQDLSLADGQAVIAWSGVAMPPQNVSGPPWDDIDPFFGKFVAGLPISPLEVKFEHM